MQVVFHVRAKRSLCTFCSPLGLFFVSGRSWRSISLDPVRDAFDGVPEENVLVKIMKTCFSALSPPCSGLGSEGPASPRIL